MSSMKLPLTASWVDCPFRFTFESRGPLLEDRQFFVVLHVLIPPYRISSWMYHPPGDDWWKTIVWKKLDEQEITPDTLDWEKISREKPALYPTPLAARYDLTEAKGIAWAAKNWPYAVYDSMEGGGG